MKKLIALILVVFFTISLTGCFNNGYTKGDLVKSLDWKKYDIGLHSKIIADTRYFEMTDVSLDFYYSFYFLGNELSPEQIKGMYSYIPSKSEMERGVRHTESVYVIYISDNGNITFEKDEDDNIIDYENNVNARLYKFISFEEAFSTNYGYSSDKLKIIYNHNEKITIPSEFFKSSNGHVYIHLIRLLHCPDDDTFSHYKYDKDTIEMEYLLLGDDIVVFK